MYLDKNILPTISNNAKNLLAFSSGVDSSALFFMLLNQNINFDIAFVNYNIRDNSKEEENYAKELAVKYDKKIYILQAETIYKNFEKEAREIRYTFFHSIIQKYNYTNLLTAHQLNDKLEWFLMQLTKGSGLSEILGLENITFNTKYNYNLIRPILHHSKDEILFFLKEHNYKYFIDESNFQDKYRRNIFRKNYSDELIRNYKKGIENSFKYLQNDKNKLNKDIYSLIFHQKKLYKIKIFNKNNLVRVVDIFLKKMNYVMSFNQREIVKNNHSIVIGNIWAVEFKENILYIAPYIQMTTPKKYREIYRIKKIPIKIRGYLYLSKINLN